MTLAAARVRTPCLWQKIIFQVTAIDSSEVAINQLNKIAGDEGFTNLEAIKADIRNFNIERDKYNIIYGGNVLQFLKKDEAEKIIETTKENHAFFKPREMKNSFKDFKIIHYFENVITDQGHASMPEPHQHGVVRIIAQKQ